MKISSSSIKTLSNPSVLNNSNPNAIGLKFIFLKHFKEFFYLKGVLISNSIVNINLDRLDVYLNLFFTKKKLLKLKKKVDRIKLLASTYKKKFKKNLKKTPRLLFRRDFLKLNKRIRIKTLKGNLITSEKTFFVRSNEKLVQVKTFDLKFLVLRKIKTDNKKVLITKNFVLKQLYLTHPTRNKKFLSLLSKSLKKKNLRRRKKFLKNPNKKFKKKIFLFKLLKEFRTKFKVNLINLKINTSNKFVSRKFFRLLKKKTKFFKTRLFTRRFNFYTDFIRLTALYKSSKISLHLFIRVLSDIFRRLTKRLHSKFISLIKELFKWIILCSNNKKTKKKLFYKINNSLTVVPMSLNLKPLNAIQGIKFILCGKIKGKLRARTNKVTIGPTPISTLNKNIEFSQTESYTVYGAFGLKLWVYRI